MRSTHAELMAARRVVREAKRFVDRITAKDRIIGKLIKLCEALDAYDAQRENGGST